MNDWAFLASRYAEVKVEPHEALLDAIEGASGLFYFQSGLEAMIYRLNSQRPQIVAVGRVESAESRGALVSEGLRRFAACNTRAGL